MADLKVNIAGDFIESYIYSGVLFTVDTNGILCSYSWKHLIEKYFHRYPEHIQWKKKILDSREGKNYFLNEDITITIDKNFLENNQKGTCTNLQAWCTDLDVKDNIMYISSEKGLETIPFMNEWNNGAVENLVRMKTVWSGSKVFGISTGSWGRTILATGVKGALEIVNKEVEQVKNIGIFKNIEKIINEDIILDCEWNSNSTLAILDGLSKKIAYKYHDIGSDSFFKDNEKAEEKLRNLSLQSKEKKIKNAMEALQKNSTEDISCDFIQTWFESGNLYAIDRNKHKHVFNGYKWVEESADSLFNETSIAKLKNIAAGSFFETEDDELFKIYKGKKLTLPENFTSWRVFPRSKNYQDRVHIVYDDFLQIRIFDL
ncbi:hypothetical protein IV493_03725 [Pantoea sp. SM3640]|uniref:hypothetical protein n=1 Tax=Pantoea sp. SM3640 TaxID=2787629 RepID=UPI0018A79281|nr:hypothetical protein [Pantoea sp. SM3640]QPG27951.1 hypothetical protein IV493_03725 [Pantoea sp. SM3640]